MPKICAAHFQGNRHGLQVLAEHVNRLVDRVDALEGKKPNSDSTLKTDTKLEKGKTK